MWTNRLTRKRACSAAVSLHLNDTIPISVSYIDNRYTAIGYVWLCCRLARIGSLLARLLQFTETSSRRDMTKPAPATNSRSETKWPAKAGFFVSVALIRADLRRFAPGCPLPHQSPAGGLPLTARMAVPSRRSGTRLDSPPNCGPSLSGRVPDAPRTGITGRSRSHVDGARPGFGPHRVPI